MFVTFDIKIGNKEMFNDFLVLGKDIFSKNQKDVHNTLEEYLLNDGRHDILLYGIAFCRKLFSNFWR